MEKPKNLKHKIYKAMLLINAYLQGVAIEDPKILADQEYILLLGPRILSYMIELSLEYSMYCKLIGLRAIKFSQLFFQVFTIYLSFRDWNKETHTIFNYLI